MANRFLQSMEIAYLNEVSGESDIMDSYDAELGEIFIFNMENFHEQHDPYVPAGLS